MEGRPWRRARDRGRDQGVAAARRRTERLTSGTFAADVFAPAFAFDPQAAAPCRRGARLYISGCAEPTAAAARFGIDAGLALGAEVSASLERYLFRAHS
jgi:hypothetical protein